MNDTLNVKNVSCFTTQVLTDGPVNMTTITGRAVQAADNKLSDQLTMYVQSTVKRHCDRKTNRYDALVPVLNCVCPLRQQVVVMGFGLPQPATSSYHDAD